MTKQRTSINIKLQPEEFSKLLDAMKTASPDSPTTPGAFLKRAALDYCDNLSTPSTAPCDSQTDGLGDTEPAQVAGTDTEPPTPETPETPSAHDSGSNERDPVDLLGLLPLPPPYAVDDPTPTTAAKRPSGIHPDFAENFEEVRQIFIAELDQVRRFISSLYIQANDTLDWLHENFRKCMRESVDTLEEARQRVKESVTGLTTGFLAAQEQAANLLDQASERNSEELQRRVETLDQVPGQLRKSSDEILAAFQKHATESSEKLTKVSTAALRVAEKLQAENFRVGLRTFLAAILATALLGLPAFGWLVWQNGRLETRADTWRANAERINQYVVETLYPHMTEKQRVETNDFYTRHRLPTPDEQDRTRAE